MNWLSVDTNTLVTISVSFIGPFSGAFAAFALEKNRRKKVRSKKENRIVKWTQFCLLCRKHVVEKLYKEFHDNEKKENRYSLVKRVELVSDVPTLNLNEILFLIKRKASSLQFLYKLFMFDRKYLNFIDALRKRNEFCDLVLHKDTDLNEKEKKALIELTNNVYKEKQSFNFDEVIDNFSTYLLSNFPRFKKSLFGVKSVE